MPVKDITLFIKQGLLTQQAPCEFCNSSEATGWMTEKSGFDSPQKQDISLLHSIQTGSGAHLASQWIQGPGREASDPLPTSAEVKNTWSYTSLPSYVFMACRLRTWTILWGVHVQNGGQQQLMVMTEGWSCGKKLCYATLIWTGVVWRSYELGLFDGVNFFFTPHHTYFFVLLIG
jgi:hypothetical protein